MGTKPYAKGFLFSLSLTLVIAISFAMLILLGVTLTIISDNSFYQKEFEKNGVYSDFGGTALPDRLAGQLISYFGDSSRAPPDIYEFSEAEKSHLLDVKLLIIGLKKAALAIALLLLMALLALGTHNRRFLSQSHQYVLIACGAAVLLFSLLFVILALNFEWAFTSFHHLFFPQGNWQFPTNSLLIRLFPEQTFFDFFTAILFKATLIGLLPLSLGAVGLLVRKKYKQKSKYNQYGQA